MRRCWQCIFCVCFKPCVSLCIFYLKLEQNKRKCSVRHAHSGHHHCRSIVQTAHRSRVLETVAHVLPHLPICIMGRGCSACESGWLMSTLASRPASRPLTAALYLRCAPPSPSALRWRRSCSSPDRIRATRHSARTSEACRSAEAHARRRCGAASDSSPCSSCRCCRGSWWQTARKPAPIEIK